MVCFKLIADQAAAKSDGPPGKKIAAATTVALYHSMGVAPKPADYTVVEYKDEREDDLYI